MARRGNGRLYAGIAVAAVAGFGIYWFVLRKGLMGTPLTVNGSVGPITVGSSSTLTFSIRGMSPNSNVRVYFNTAPTVVAGMFQAAAGTADGGGNVNLLYTLIPPAQTFYAVAFDGVNYSNWVKITTV